jgi:hypothetical protein
MELTDWMQLAYNTIQWQDLVRKAINFRATKKKRARDFLTK